MARVFLLGDNIDTDVISPGGYLHLGLEDIKKHSLEAVYPDFWKKAGEGDIIIAGKNFGTGSSREQAPLVLREMGISIVIAESFARIFFRNAINTGVPIGVIRERPAFVDGDIVEVNYDKGEIRRLRDGYTVPYIPPEGILKDILREGGLVKYTSSKLSDE